MKPNSLRIRKQSSCYEHDSESDDSEDDSRSLREGKFSSRMSASSHLRQKRDDTSDDNSGSSGSSDRARITRSNSRKATRQTQPRSSRFRNHRVSEESDDDESESSITSSSNASSTMSNSQSNIKANRRTRSSRSSQRDDIDDSSDDDHILTRRTRSNARATVSRSNSRRQTDSSSDDASSRTGNFSGRNNARITRSNKRKLANIRTTGQNKKRTGANVPKPDTLNRRRSSRGNSSLSELAKHIIVDKKRVVFITGAGVSVASGVRPFRGSSGVWTHIIWTTATREAFRKDPLKWYNAFWVPMFLQTSLPPPDHNRQRTQYEDGSSFEVPVTALLHPNPQPNAGHLALAELMNDFSNIQMITQNVDGLHPPSNRLIEAHGRVGLYKCLPTEDSDTDSDSDDDDEREVHLGHRRKRRTAQSMCPYQQAMSLTGEQLEPQTTRDALLRASDPTSPENMPSNSSRDLSGRTTPPSDAISSARKRRIVLDQAPKCPSCGNCVAPQALLFDEGYHNHDFYQFRLMEEWIAKAEVIVFVGTSFAGVSLTEVALEHAREKGLPVYNFNTRDFLESTFRLNAENVSGPSEETLPQLLAACRDLKKSADELVKNASSRSITIPTQRPVHAMAPVASIAGSPIRVQCS